MWKDLDAEMKTPPRFNSITLTQHKRKMSCSKKVKSLVPRKCPRETRAPKSRCQKTSQQTRPMNGKIHLMLILILYEVALRVPPVYIYPRKRATYYRPLTGSFIDLCCLDELDFEKKYFKSY